MIGGGRGGEGGARLQVHETLVALRVKGNTAQHSAHDVWTYASRTRPDRHSLSRGSTASRLHGVENRRVFFVWQSGGVAKARFSKSVIRTP